MLSSRERWERLKIVAKEKGLPIVCKLKGKETLYIPSPEQVESLIKSIPKGKLMTTNDVCNFFAKKYKTTKGCAMTIGQILMVIAHLNDEEKTQCPWWRVIKNNGELHPNYPGSQKALLEKEGHKVVKRGTKLFVKAIN
jgi:alkylated DNA nucleotide flippase Atl1